MSLFEEYNSQSEGFVESSSHYDAHTDRYVDDSSDSIYAHSGHVDVHTDEKYY